MKLIIEGYIPMYDLLVKKEVITENFYIDKLGNFEAEKGIGNVTGKFFNELQNCNSIRNVPKKLQEFEFLVRSLRMKEEFNFKLTTLQKSKKKFEDYKVGDFVIPNGGNKGNIVKIDFQNKQFAVPGSRDFLGWYNESHILDVIPSIYDQFLSQFKIIK
jgi:hypothetical protein